MQTAQNDLIVKTIFDQLGGESKVRSMLGITQCIPTHNGCEIRYTTKGLAGNHLTISLRNDLYDIDFIKIHGVSCKLMKFFRGIQASQLKEVIENTTSLALTL